MNNIKLKWIEVHDNYLGDYYSLRDNNDEEIAYIWYFDKHWSLTPVLYYDLLPKKIYFDYNETDVKEVEFRAVLDIMSALNKIGNKCFDYSNAISEYVEEYLKEINKENNNEN